MRKILPESKTSEKGQVVLIVLLIMSVILVVGLSIASRSVTDIKISQQSQESARALWVAQAGLEQAIKTNTAIGVGSSLGGVSYSVSKVDIGAGREFVFPGNISADETATFWLIDHDTSGEISSEKFPGGGKLTFFWGKDGSPNDTDTTPALEATLVYKSGSNFLVKRYPFDPNSSRRGSSTNFDSPSSSACSSFGDGTKFAFCSNEITIPGGTPYLVRLKLLFNTNTSHPIGVKGNSDFPQQGSCFESSATVPESGVSRKLRQCQLWNTVPSIFDNVLFSGTNIE